MGLLLVVEKLLLLEFTLLQVLHLLLDHCKRPGDDLLFSYRQLSMLIGFDKFLPISVDFYRTSFQLDGRSGSRSS